MRSEKRNQQRKRKDANCGRQGRPIPYDKPAGQVSNGVKKRKEPKLSKSKRILIKEEYCIGCRLCETWCVVAHSKSKDIIKTYKGTAPLPESAIYFEEKGPLSFTLQCRHCDDAPCLYACLTGALYRDRETGRILHDKDKCIGCWMCLMVCPYGVIKPDLKNRKVASKCDLCIDTEFPACVEHCPNEAIVLLDESGKKIERT